MHLFTYYAFFLFTLQNYFIAISLYSLEYYVVSLEFLHRMNADNTQTPRKPGTLIVSTVSMGGGLGSGYLTTPGLSKGHLVSCMTILF